MAKWLLMWTGSVAAFVLFIVISQVLLGGDREFPESGDEGFKMLYPQDLPLNEVHFFIDTTKTPTSILFFAVVDVENRIESSLIALQVPYSGIVREESGWDWRPFEESTVLIKAFTCSEEDPCTFVDNIQYLEFELDEPIDQRQSFRHSVRLWFSQENPLLESEIPPLLKNLNKHRKPYHIGFDEIPDAKATVIFDKGSDSFAPTPNADIVPGSKADTIQLDWLVKGGILHQIDYQLTGERDLETKLLYYTAVFGIGLGVLSLALYGAEKRNKKVEDDRHHGPTVNHFEKDAIDDSYHQQKQETSSKGREVPRDG